MESFNLEKLNKADGKQQYHVEAWSRFVAVEDLDPEVEINSDPETIRI